MAPVVNLNYKTTSKIKPKTQLSSRLKGFYKKNRNERVALLSHFANLTYEEQRLLQSKEPLAFDNLNVFIENAVGSFQLPLGIATNFLINGKDYLIPMAVEESSVIAATSNAARIAYENGGFQARTLSSMMIGQIQLLDIKVENFTETKELILMNKELLIDKANKLFPRLVLRNGGTKDIEVHCFPEAPEPFMVVHLLIDTKEAMGANLINTVCEQIASEIEKFIPARVGLRILSNLASKKIFESTVRINPENLELNCPNFKATGHEIAKRIAEATMFATHDPHRAATHNKGIMNGVDPIVIATGNDWRAIEAGAHAYASRRGQYQSLSQWFLDGEGFLCGKLELPMQLGTVGGVTRLHPMAALSFSILDYPSANELAQVITSVGLASNLTALRALVTTGIQRGHMRLHAKNLALSAGATEGETELVIEELCSDGNFSLSLAESILADIRWKRNNEQDPNL